MLRFTLREMARLVSALFGAAVLTAAIAALASASAWHGVAGFCTSFAHRADGFLRLDFGVSIVSASPAMSDLAARLPPTLIVVALGLLIALAIGGPLGIVLGAGPARRAAAPLLQVIAAAPVFCAALAIAFVAQNIFHFGVGTQPSDTTFKIDPRDLVTSLKPLLLPALAVGAAGVAQVQLALRRGAAAVAEQPWRRGLRQLGLPAFEIDRVYVAPHVIAALVGSFGEIVLALLAASAVAEWVFDIPGAAVLFVKSVALGDWTVAALVLFAFAALALVAESIGQIGARAIADSGRAA